MAGGPVLIGLPGLALDEQTRDWLQHPLIGGIVLFARNFESEEQVCELVSEIRGACEPRPLVCVDQEGGRVQRFIGKGFTRLPPLGVLGRLHDSDPVKALDMAYRHGRVMAMEMLAVGVDLSFAPVLDLDRGSRVIGDRSISHDPEIVTLLGRSYLAGMRDAGMRATGKHFPGHGSVVADSHVDDVTDGRSLDEIRQSDLRPFEELMPALDALMIAHVVYPQVDDRPAGYSAAWLKDILRDGLGYRGVVMSDDLGMKAACVAGGVRERAEHCLAAGCDLVLVCQPGDTADLMADPPASLKSACESLDRLYGRPTIDRSQIAEVRSEGIREWEYWRSSLERLGESWS